MDYSPIAAHASESARAAFIRRTYGHLAGAILAFVAIQFALFQSGVAEKIIEGMFRTFHGGVGLLILFGLFIGVSWLANMWAHSETSPAVQYMGLGLYVVLEAIIFLPILYIAQHFVKDDTIIPTAAILTLAIFGGLTLTVFTTRKDFSFLGPILSVSCLVALGVIIAGILFGFHLGLFFSFAMIAVASGFILYDTSNVLHHYRTTQHVAAALALFASVALLFYYILRVLIEVSGRANN
jgi:FtsH-binding integral membrane protein